MGRIIRIGTRESELAMWQASQVSSMLEQNGYAAELVYIKSEGDIDLKTPLYEMGVQGIFTRSLDAALLNNKIDSAVHSMKDVPTQLPEGVTQAAVLKRGPVNDLLVFKNKTHQKKYLTLIQDSRTDSYRLPTPDSRLIIATSSIRRKAQWLNKFPGHSIKNLRGNVNTRLQKLQQENWDAAIFAQAGLERINLRPQTSIVLDWMLPAPAQGAVVIVCRQDDELCFEACNKLNDEDTALCTKIERDFLRQLLGGCSTPISALAEVRNDQIHFKGNVLSPDGSKKLEVEGSADIYNANDLGIRAAVNILQKGAMELIGKIKDVAK